MENKLTIEHLSAYLPYGLKARLLPMQEVSNVTGVFYDNLGLHEVQINNDGFYALQRVKPLLRPLSDLTKEIWHNGEKFNPTREINKLLNNGVYARDYNNIIFNEYGSLRVDFGDHDTGFSVNFEAIPVIIKLFEWHFDVFGLIEKGLAIDINTLK